MAFVVLTEKQRGLEKRLIAVLPQLRKTLGVSQTLLGKKIGVSRQTISKVERGQQELTWTMFLAIIFFLKTNSNFFFNKRTTGGGFATALDEYLTVSNEAEKSLRTPDFDFLEQRW